MPEDLFRRTRERASRRNLSVNALLQQVVTATLKAEQDARLYEAFGLLGTDTEGSDVEFAASAQSEVVRRARR